MTNSPRWSNARPNGSNSSAEPAGSGSPRGSIRLALRRDRSLAEGMAITAAIDARLLGMRLLNLRAAINVVPAEASQTADDLSAAPRRLPDRSRSPGRRSSSGARTKTGRWRAGCGLAGHRRRRSRAQSRSRADPVGRARRINRLTVPARCANFRPGDGDHRRFDGASAHRSNRDRQDQILASKGSGRCSDRVCSARRCAGRRGRRRPGLRGLDRVAAEGARTWRSSPTAASRRCGWRSRGTRPRARAAL